MTTQGAIFNYEEVIDLHTEANKVSVIGIHTPTGDTPRKLCPGFFQQFKKYKYLGCSVSLVPAATLPADPLQVGAVESGAPTIDPRDMLNPIMFHGCHGNDLGNILDRLYSSGLADSSDLTQIIHSDSLDFMSMANYEEDGDAPFLDIMESLYYRALTDNTWKKAHIQRGFRKSGLKPRIYSLATNMQLMGQTTLGSQRAPGIIEGTYDLSEPLSPAMDIEDPVVNPVRYFTPRTVPLGWLDTRQVVPYVAEGQINDVALDDIQSTIENLIKGKTVWNELPEIYMGIIMLPPAYLQEQYFRLIINHSFAFRGFRGISMSNDMLEMPPNYQDWNDEISIPEPAPPVPEDPVVVDTNGSSTLFGNARYVYQSVLLDDEDTKNMVNPYTSGVVINGRTSRYFGITKIGDPGEEVHILVCALNKASSDSGWLAYKPSDDKWYYASSMTNNPSSELMVGYDSVGTDFVQQFPKSIWGDYLNGWFS